MSMSRTRQPTQVYMTVGHMRHVIDGFLVRDVVTATETREEATRGVVADWHRAQQVQPDVHPVMLAGTRAKVDSLNQAARAALKCDGVLGHGVTVDTARGEREIGQGERVVFLRDDPTLSVVNGQCGTVQQVRRGPDGVALRITTDDGRTIALNPATFRDLDHAYALSIYQAGTLGSTPAYVLAGHRHARELEPLSGTRGNTVARLYIATGDLTRDNAIARSAQRMHQSHQKDTTLDYPTLARNGTEIGHGH